MARKQITNNPPRRRAHRQAGRRYLIVCEGETEKTYFRWVRDMLNEKTIVIRSTTGSSPDQVAVALEAVQQGMPDERRGLFPYDEVWAVFDWDERTDRVEQAKKVLEDANKAAKKKDYSVSFNMGLSNPLFEIWFLWHLTDYQATGCLGNDVLRATRKQCPEYVKGSGIPTSRLKGQYQRAYDRAVKAAKSHQRDGRTFPEDRPRSDVADLMDSIVTSWRRFRGIAPTGPSPL